VTLLEGLAAVLLILGSVLVLRTVLLADRAEDRAGPREASPEAPRLRKAA
jgi:hypothetical protein